MLRDILRRQSIFTFPPGIVSKQVFSLQKCCQLVMMRSGHNSSGRNMDEGRLGTPAQRPIAFGGQRMANDPVISMRRGEGTQRLGYPGMSDPIRYGTGNKKALDETWFPDGNELEIEDYVEQSSEEVFSEVSFGKHDDGQMGGGSGASRPAQKPQSEGMRGTRERDQTLATRGGPEYQGPKVARQHFYAVAKGRREGVFLSWEETEPLVQGFSGAVHQRFDSLDEAMQYLDDWDHRRLPEPNVSALEMEKLRLFNAQRRSRGTTSEAASSYKGPRLSQEDLGSVERRTERGIGYHGGSGAEVMAEGVAYQGVEAIHHDNRELGKDWDHGEEQSVDLGELSGSDDSIITEVLRRTQLDPGDTHLRGVLAEVMKEAKSRMTLGGGGSRDARGDPRQARVLTHLKIKFTKILNC